jgi:LmbE family N-acetylglucosaminyl deacetylase
MKKILLMAYILFLVTGSAVSQAKATPDKCIMVFGAHADDVESLAGGTFSKYISGGYQGIYVCVINNTAGCAIESVGGGTHAPNGRTMLFSGSSSPMTYPVDALETIQIRQEEARNAAEFYGSIPEFLNFSQPEFFLGRKLIIYGTNEFIGFNPPGRKQISLATRYDEDVELVFDLLKKYKPEIVITHTLGGEKLDHEGTAYMMYLAFVQAMDEGIPVGKLLMTVNGWLTDFPASKNSRGKPDLKVNVKKYLEAKYTALNLHLSQNGGFGREYMMESHKPVKETIEEFITVIDNTR